MEKTKWYGLFFLEGVGKGKPAYKIEQVVVPNCKEGTGSQWALFVINKKVSNKYGSAYTPTRAITEEDMNWFLDYAEFELRGYQYPAELGTNWSEIEKNQKERGWSNWDLDSKMVATVSSSGCKNSKRRKKVSSEFLGGKAQFFTINAIPFMVQVAVPWMPCGKTQKLVRKSE